MPRYTNAYFHFRKGEIDRMKNVKMTVISKETAPKWRKKNDSQKRKHFHAAAKDYVDKEIASGTNHLTTKSFEQHGNIAFVIETPIIKTEKLYEEQLVHTNVQLVQSEISEVIYTHSSLNVGDVPYASEYEEFDEFFNFDFYNKQGAGEVVDLERDNNNFEMIGGVPTTEYRK
ncbi:8207_t:CDS:1 [Funneliformis mosseae]|uniref:8207_t:CDS:1 n=1 Tax=Funneliformis mosseae TaxID=27381 RepID=A0A9N9EFN4_FUNMO|nr:8207_t:CDS:1 [Funneliformis mosseae]